MLIIEEWVLVTNPYAVGYQSSALFLVCHHQAICLCLNILQHNSVGSNAIGGNYCLSYTWTLLPVTHVLFRKSPTYPIRHERDNQVFSFCLMNQIVNPTF